MHRPRHHLAGALGGMALVLAACASTGQASPTSQATSTSTATPLTSPDPTTAPSPPPLSTVPGLIAFSRDDDAYTMRPDGSAVTRLTADPATGAAPIAWLTDGSRLVIGRAERHEAPFDPNATFPSTLSLIRPDGSEAVDMGILLNQQSSPPTYSPDGTMIAFGGDGTAGTGIAVLDLVHGTLAQLTTDGGHGPLWSPDGLRIAYQAAEGAEGLGNDVWVVALDGLPPVSLAPDQNSEDYPIRWTIVDGTLKLIFGSFRGTDQTKFAARPWVVNADGTDVLLLADSGLNANLDTYLLPTRVSPDGLWVASGCDAGLCVAATNGTGATRVFERGMGPGGGYFPSSWSPDSRYLAYSVIAGRDDPRGVIKIQFVGGGEPVTISGPDTWDSDPVWQPVPG